MRRVLINGRVVVADEATLAGLQAQGLLVQELGGGSFPPPSSTLPVGQFRDVSSFMIEVLGDVRRLAVTQAADMNELSQAFGILVLEQTKRFTEELARARAASQKSLGDVDMLARAIVAHNFGQATVQGQATVETTPEKPIIASKKFHH
jgi:hypothetical protein